MKLQLKIQKFGGTSVGSADRLRALIPLVQDGDANIIVLSAMSGTTDSLLAIAHAMSQGNGREVKQLIGLLEDKYKKVIADLFPNSNGLAKAEEMIASYFRSMYDLINTASFLPAHECALLAHGELLSTSIFHLLLQENSIPAVFLPALEFMRINESGVPDMEYIEVHLKQLLDQYPDCNLFITQGFICRNDSGAIDNLKRGGSDYSATIIGAAVRAAEIQIWTDIDGMHNNDPRIIKDTYPIAELSFDEAAELAYFGAKILHPTCILPAKSNNIPVRLLHTMHPEAKGTRISARNQDMGIKAIAAKDGITAIKIKSDRMLMAYGFLRAVFEIFERHKTPIDMITTAEVAVSLTIDDKSNLESILKELQSFCSVEVDENLTIICIVGHMPVHKEGCACQVFDSLKHIPVRMISYGGSESNMSVLVHTDFKKEAMLSLNRGLFAGKETSCLQ
jgi:aspartate kinase